MPQRTSSQLIVDYKRGAAVLREALGGLDDSALTARPIPGKMSAKEVACHIVDSDQFMCDRLRRTVATDKPLLVGVYSAGYSDALDYHSRDLELDLRLLEIQREQLAADLDKLPESAWSRKAVHTENGMQSLLEILDHAVDHLESHVATIYEKRHALGV